MTGRLCILVLVLVMSASPALPAQGYGAAGTSSPASLAAHAERPLDESLLLAELNQARVENGRRAVLLDRRLAAAARAHALDMIAHDYFAHQMPGGPSAFDFIARTGVSYGFAGETLALNVSPDAVTAKLLDDPPHRSIMLDARYRRVGISAVSTPSGELYVEDFTD
jgi:uncharacterized protein YkwD